MGIARGVDLLLDTHVWIWATRRPSLIPPAVQRLLDDPSRLRYLSPISLAEALLLAVRGRLDIDEPFERSLDGMLAASSVIELPLQFEAVLASRSIDIPTRDPSDRLIGATARCYGLKLVTADRAFRRARGLDVHWFRARGHP